MSWNIIFPFASALAFMWKVEQTGIVGTCSLLFRFLFLPCSSYAVMTIMLFVFAFLCSEHIFKSVITCGLHGREAL